MDLRGWGERVRAALRRRRNGGKPPPQQGRRPRGRPAWAPQGALAGMRPALVPEEPLRRFDDLRRQFPVLDVAIAHLVHLVGRVEVEGSPAEEREWRQWLATVRVNQAQRGFQAWLEAHVDAMLLYGYAVGELIPERRGRDLFALLNLDSRTICFRAGPDPLALEILQHQRGRLEPVALDPSVTLLSTRSPQSDNPYGVSLFRSLPFAAEACSVIENATLQAWIRMGNPSFHVNWRSPGSEFADPQGGLSDEVLAEMQGRFNEIMAARHQGEIRDFFTSGQVEVSTIGSDGHLQSLGEPLRAFAEQIVAATGLPPWLLGLHWSTTERLSVQQADLLVANIEALRRAIQPQVQRAFDLRQRLRGAPGAVKLRWSAINLRDLVEQARAEAWREQARQRRIENARRMWELGFWSQARAARDADPDLARVDRVLESPPSNTNSNL
jgi:hypothetical protein